MTLRVESCAGYRGDPEPQAFWLGQRRIEVRAIQDRWFGRAQRWFRVATDEGHAYVLHHDQEADEWELAAFTHLRA